MEEVTHPTATQYALACCFILIAPALGFVGAVVRRNRGGSPALGALIVAASSWTGWLASCVVAIVLFPGYPREAIPEHIAMLFVVPGFVAAGAALAWIVSRRPAKRERRDELRVGIAGIALALVASAGLVGAHRYLTVSLAIRSLPPTAVVLHEQREMYDDFLGDYFYSVTARMTPEQFRAWMQALDMPHVSADEYGNPHESGGDCGERGRYADGIGTYQSWCS